MRGPKKFFVYADQSEFDNIRQYLDPAKTYTRNIIYPELLHNWCYFVTTPFYQPDAYPTKCPPTILSIYPNCGIWQMLVRQLLQTHTPDFSYFSPIQFRCGPIVSPTNFPITFSLMSPKCSTCQMWFQNTLLIHMPDSSYFGLICVNSGPIGSPTNFPTTFLIMSPTLNHYVPFFMCQHKLLFPITLRER